MDDSEIPLKIRRLILGHSAPDITSKVYTHKTVSQLLMRLTAFNFIVYA